MAAIPCVDYVRDEVPPIPLRPRRANPDAIRNRFANFVFSMDLSPSQRDELGAGVGAWSMWDIPALHAAQIDDDRGEDLICVAVQDNIYWLDWRRYQDEWVYNGFAPINRLIRVGPAPSSDENTLPAGGYNLGELKRLSEFQFGLKDGASGVASAFWTITAGEWDNEEATSRTTVRRTAGRMRARLAVKGRSFIITLEHSANEPVNIEHWRALWDNIGRRIRESGVA